ncbi:hypothetical protein GMMP15_2100010 [Candidatus Magnetomoraceae bacterium gMMP-15]
MMKTQRLRLNENTEVKVETVFIESGEQAL